MNTTTAPRPAESPAPLLRELVDEHWVDFALGHVSPLWSLRRTKARVVTITKETDDAIRIELAPNRNWKGHAPGQFVLVKVIIGGVMHERCYSLVSAPDDRIVQIAVKRQPGGLVSNWLHDSLRVGDVIELGRAQGEFCLPPSNLPPLLLVAGGSGITPVFALANAALATRADADVVLAYYARTKNDFILGDRLLALAAKHPSLRLHFFVDVEATSTGPSIETARVGRFGAEHVELYAPDANEREIYVCGPPGLMNAVTAHFEARGLGAHLNRESFGPSFTARTTEEPAEVSFARTGLVSHTTKPNLLEAAEEAGLRPTFGCRMGICHTCTCTKVSGVVRDRVTGALDDAPGSRIRLCVSEPVSAVCLDL